MNIRWNQVAVAAAAGFFLGAVFSDFYHVHRRPGLPPMDGPMEMFTRELDLSGPQQKKVSAILKKHEPEMEKVMEANRPKMDEVRLRIKSELNGVLTPEQSAKLEELEKDFGPDRQHGPSMRHGLGGF